MTIVKMEGRPTSQPSRGKTKPGQQRIISNGTGSSVVAAAHLVPMIDAITSRLAGEAGENEPGYTGTTILCQQINRMFGVPVDAAYRRILRCRTDAKTTSANAAEQIALAGGERLQEWGVMELPASVTAARERIRIWFEIKGSPPPKWDELTEMARDLFEFTLLMVHGPEEFFDLAEAEAA